MYSCTNVTKQEAFSFSSTSAFFGAVPFNLISRFKKQYKPLSQFIVTYPISTICQMHYIFLLYGVYFRNLFSKCDSLYSLNSPTFMNTFKKLSSLMNCNLANFWLGKINISNLIKPYIRFSKTIKYN